jgi:quinoprotein dehydrogenase-associated probable ABC transporter substrate-binding protein
VLHRAALAAGVFLAALTAASAAEGPVREAVDTDALRVCADPASLPFSNQAEQGFENKIVRLIAGELKRPLQFYWFPQSVGFVRNTLHLRQCDVISGIPTAQDLVQNTNPYYRSVYVMVYRTGAGIKALSVGDPALREMKVGVVAGTPPASLLARYGMLERVRPYDLVVDTRFDTPAKRAIEDVAAGEIDVALIWGPIAGYFAKQQKTALTLVPLVNEPPDARMDFHITMAVRPTENEWKRQLNEVLKKLEPQIAAILKDYSVPLLDAAGKPIP